MQVSRDGPETLVRVSYESRAIFWQLSREMSYLCRHLLVVVSYIRRILRLAETKL